LSYVGELGYEIYVENKDAKEIYNLILSTGKIYSLTHCGVHALDTMRMENGFFTLGS
jgi:glycine cleavage system aminomethyltransferase T